MAEAPIKVMIIDDHRMFAESLARLLEDEADIEVVGVGTNRSDALGLARRLRPAVALVDYQMPGGDGVSLARSLKEVDAAILTVMLTGFDDEELLLEAIDAGCSGFITKDRAAAEVVDAVRAAAGGEALISPQMLARLLPQLSREERPARHRLTDREIEMLSYMARGFSNRAIADQLYLSVNTVRNHVQSILGKLGAHSKLEAVSIAVRTGIIEMPSS
ncbi:MAG: response regulator transcription factor [Actinomycetota bacterium]|nr:response regulator transcription factor [Actinomycetota bacterium]MDA8209584.1 response regulator transcription factor [Actinomycetota bacterium]